jgi:methionine-rich copper-binding protein CopC
VVFLAPRKRCVACIVLSGCMTLTSIPGTSAHAFLTSSVPSADSTVGTPPKEVKLSYSEPIEIRFSIFKVYKLSAAPGADMRALRAAAADLVSANLLKRGDEAARSDVGVATPTRTGTEIVVRLKDLEPGAYVVMWRVLSVDTHTTQGWFVFVYTPALPSAHEATEVQQALAQCHSRRVAGTGNRRPGADSCGVLDAAQSYAGQQFIPATQPASAGIVFGMCLSAGVGWVPVSLPSDFLSVPIGQGGDPNWALSPRRVRLPELDPVDVSRLRLADEPTLSLEAVAGPQDPSIDIWAAAPAVDATLRPPLQALQVAAPDRLDQPANIQVSWVLMYRFVNASVPPVAGDTNINDLTPTPDTPTIHDGILEAAINWTLSPTFSLFADLALEARTAAGLSPSDIEQLYLDAHNLFGVTGAGMRLGRDRIKLGFDGLLMDETVFDGGRRDGIEIRLPSLGPVSLFGFMQYALDDGLQLGNWTSTRRVWGGRAEAEVLPGWTVNVSYRADTAAQIDAGTCPGIGCNIGSGFSAGVQGNLMAGMNLIAEAATYTQSGDIGRWYYESSLALDLRQLLGVQPLQPVLTLWYKNFDPYTLPLDAPLGHLLTPDDFKIFNTNDNLTALGARLDLSVTPAVSVFALAEWGTYKNSGPTYNVYSVGVKYALASNTLLKVAYNGYSVGGGIVTTSPASGLQLSNAQVFEVELTSTF